MHSVGVVTLHLDSIFLIGWKTDCIVTSILADGCQDAFSVAYVHYAHDLSIKSEKSK